VNYYVSINLIGIGIRAVAIVIVWQLDLQLPIYAMHSVSVTAKVVSSNPAHGDTTLCDKVF